MKIRFALFAAAALFLLPADAMAARGSCSSFATIKSFDAGAKTVELKFKKGNANKFFPRPEGAANVSKIPGPCKGRATRQDAYPVKLTGGRLSVTQVRMNFSGKMLNDTDDASWLPKRLEKLIADKTEVIVVIRPGLKKSDPLGPHHDLHADHGRGAEGDRTHRVASRRRRLARRRCHDAGAGEPGGRPAERGARSAFGATGAGSRGVEYEVPLQRRPRCRPPSRSRSAPATRPSTT